MSPVSPTPGSTVSAKSDGEIVNRVDHREYLDHAVRERSTMLTKEPAVAVIPAPSAPTHELAGARFTSLATPSRGSSDTSVWLVEIAPGTAGRPHQLTREEVFVVLAG